MRVAVDSSALVKLLLEERESADLEAFFRSSRDDEFIVSSLALVELRRLAIRSGGDLPEPTELLAGFRVIRLTPAVLQLAGRLQTRQLGTLDAIHIATALVASATALVTYDRTQASAAEHEGLLVRSPDNRSA